MRLEDNKNGAAYEVTTLIAEGNRFQVAGCSEVGSNGTSEFCAKTVLGADLATLPIDESRLVLRSIPALLSGLSDEIARPVALAELPGLGDEVEPILVSERVDGRNLFEWLREERPAGMELQEAMPLIAEILSVVRKLHAGDLLVCDLDPRHFVVERGSEKLRYVATGNITRISKPPLGLTSGVYRAPEIRHEQSGRFLRPCADVFSLGLLIVFLMTAEEPALDPRSPLSRRAYDRLKNLPAGPRVWLAKMIQPMGKSRFSNLDKLQRHGPGNWPKPTDRGFGFLELPPPAGPALTPGPLVSR